MGMDPKADSGHSAGDGGGAWMTGGILGKMGRWESRIWKAMNGKLFEVEHRSPGYGSYYSKLYGTGRHSPGYGRIVQDLYGRD